MKRRFNLAKRRKKKSKRRFIPDGTAFRFIKIKRSGFHKATRLFEPKSD